MVSFKSVIFYQIIYKLLALIITTEVKIKILIELSFKPLFITFFDELIFLS